MEEIRNNADPKIGNLLKHAKLFLEDGEWDSANAYCDTVLETEPENTQAYLMKLMAELKVSQKEELYKCEEPFDNNKNYKKLLQLGDEQLVDELEKCNELIKEKFDKEKIYTLALKRFKQATNEEHFRIAMESFEKVADYKDSDEKILYCYREIEEARKESVYQKAVSFKNLNSEQGFKDAVLLFEQIPDYKDSKDQIEHCKRNCSTNAEYVLEKKTKKIEKISKK